MSKGEKKQVYFEKLEKLLETYNGIFIVNVDNVGSNQMHQIRQNLRGEGVVLMGKNTMVRKVLRNLITTNPKYEKLMSVVRGNTGFVFTNADMQTIRKKITENRVQAPAKAGAIAPVPVVVPAGNTGMPPDKTSFFQALGVPTKISRGTIEIISDVNLIKVGDKVGASEAALLNMLNISPFTYGMTVTQVYSDGQVFEPSVLDLTNEQIIENIVNGIKRVACISLALSHPSISAVPHLLVNGYKKIVNVALGTDYSFPAVDVLKELLSNPEKLAALAASAPVAAAAAAPGAKAEEKKVEEEEESDDDMGFGLFD